MSRRLLALAVPAATAIAVMAACGGSGYSGTPIAEPSATTSATPASEPTTSGEWQNGGTVPADNIPTVLAKESATCGQVGGAWTSNGTLAGSSCKVTYLNHADHPPAPFTDPVAFNAQGDVTPFFPGQTQAICEQNTLSVWHADTMLCTPA